jgi:glycosyltransferase involved in cell wall biosynthesis
MKILFISYYGWNFGGGETYLFALKDALVARGHDVRIFSSDNEAEHRTLESDFTFRCSRNIPGRIVNSLIGFSSVNALKKVLNEFEPDLVHVNSVSNEVSPSVTWILKKYPTIMPIMSRNLFTPDKNLPLWYRPYAMLNTFTRRHFLKHIDLFTTVSRSTKATIPPKIKPVKIVNVGVNPLAYSPIINYDRILFSGRIVEEKGLGVLLAAMNIIMRTDRNILLTIAGEGPLKEFYKSYVVQHKLQNNVKFVNHISNTELEKKLIATTILVLPSIYEEPFGLSGIEAMFVGRPVIGSAIGGIPEWLKSTCGELVKPNSSEVLASAIIKMLNDKDRLQFMSLAANVEAQKYATPFLAQKMEKIYEDVIKRH